MSTVLRYFILEKLVQSIRQSHDSAVTKVNANVTVHKPPTMAQNECSWPLFVTLPSATLRVGRS